MSSKGTEAASDSRDPIVVEAQRYRDQFSGKRLRELTVHHKDHNHDNNPPDGNNWELLCLYCHENEHARNEVADAHRAETPSEEREPTSTYKPFAGLADVLKRST